MQKKKPLDWSLKDGLTRRTLLKGTALAGIGLAGTGMLAGCSTTTGASSASATPAAAKAAGKRKVDPIKPIATSEDAAFKWWFEQLQKDSAPMESVALTAEEETKVKGMGLRIGALIGQLDAKMASKEDLATIASMRSRCKDLNIEFLMIESQGSPINSVKTLIDLKADAVVNSVGSANSKESGEATKLLYDAGIPNLAYHKPSSAFYPILSTVMTPRISQGAQQARLLAQKIADAGFNKGKVGQIRGPLGFGAMC